MQSTALNINQEAFDHSSIMTTLRDLVEVIAEEVGPEEDPLVAEIILDLIETDRIRFMDPKGAVRILWT
ncbi:hypothetical protein ACFL4N_05925 [Thermodesulfobacteriota bacterium]